MKLPKAATRGDPDTGHSRRYSIDFCIMLNKQLMFMSVAMVCVCGV
jgi:hypothetical protein